MWMGTVKMAYQSDGSKGIPLAKFLPFQHNFSGGEEESSKSNKIFSPSISLLSIKTK